MVKTKAAPQVSSADLPLPSPREHVEELNPAIEVNDFGSYQLGILHDWLKTITILAFTLVPLFFILDLFFSPRDLLLRFAVYRLSSTALSLAQFFMIKRSRPSKWSYLHGYAASLQIGCMITLMTVDLGGFNSSYYAGLNLVIVGVNLLLPWTSRHTAVNSFMVLVIYVAFNLAANQPYFPAILANNLFFLVAMSFVAISINHVRYRLIEKEFSLLVLLKDARDALWGEMEVAKRIQTSLFPKTTKVMGYEICAAMVPANEVGGDYYDVVEAPNGDRWVAIGDVSGHGVESGLIMMMAQTSVMTIVKSSSINTPSQVLVSTNAVLRENISRLNSNHYMTLTLLKLGDDGMSFAGRHQDILVHRAGLDRVDVIATSGTWLGITDDLAPFVEEREVAIGPNDLVLLFTDGVTELQDASSSLFGQERLEDAFRRYAHLPVQKALSSLFNEIRRFSAQPLDDITIVLLRRVV